MIWDIVLIFQYHITTLDDDNNKNDNNNNDNVNNNT